MYPSRGGIKVCSRPLWGLISAGYQGIIGGRAAKRQFTPRTEVRGPSPPAAAADGDGAAAPPAISAEEKEAITKAGMGALDQALGSMTATPEAVSQVASALTSIAPGLTLPLTLHLILALTP